MHLFHYNLKEQFCILMHNCRHKYVHFLYIIAGIHLCILTNHRSIFSGRNSGSLETIYPYKINENFPHGQKKAVGPKRWATIVTCDTAILNKVFIHQTPSRIFFVILTPNEKQRKKKKTSSNYTLLFNFSWNIFQFSREALILKD